MTTRVPTFVGALALAMLALAPSSEAQCFTPDGFSGPCCTPASPALPTSLPPLAFPGLGICWTACAPSTNACIDLFLGPLNPTPLCTQYQVDLSVGDCAGVALMKGTVTLDYMRTWSETPIPGAVPNQVWRFAAKVDLLPSSSALACPTPSCMPTAGQAFFYGYVDYARDCGTGAIEGSIVLYHGCDRFIHNPTYSSIPGSFHPTTSYGIVGPNTAANPFVPAILPPPTGTLTAGGLRTPPTLPTEPCLVEEPALQGNLTTLVQGCLCPLSFQPPQQAGVQVAISGACGGSATSLNLFPLTPWFHMITTSIGTWTTGASYPGPERVSVAEGLFLFNESCTATGLPEPYFDVSYGSLTDGGFLVVPTGPLLPSQTFLDLASNYSLPASSPVTLPVFGKVARTDHVTYANL